MTDRALFWLLSVISCNIYKVGWSRDYSVLLFRSTCSNIRLDICVMMLFSMTVLQVSNKSTAIRCPYFILLLCIMRPFRFRISFRADPYHGPWLQQWLPSRFVKVVLSSTSHNWYCSQRNINISRPEKDPWAARMECIFHHHRFHSDARPTVMNHPVVPITLSQKKLARSRMHRSAWLFLKILPPRMLSAISDNEPSFSSKGCRCMALFTARVEASQKIRLAESWRIFSWRHFGRNSNNQKSAVSTMPHCVWPWPSTLTF